MMESGGFELKTGFDGGAPKKRAADAAADRNETEALDFEMTDEVAWKMIERYFLDDPQNLVKHHTESYSDFFKRGIFQIFREKNPLTIYSKIDPVTKEYRNRVDLYFGGKTGEKIYFGKPTIYDDAENSHFMFPNEARLRNMTYGMSVHYDIDYEVTYLLDEDQTPHLFLGGRQMYEGGVGGETAAFEDNDGEEIGPDFRGSAGEQEEEDRTPTSGGAPGRGRPAKKAAAATAATAEYDINPSLAAMIRDATEKTMVATREQKSELMTLSRIFLGKFPIMLQSDFCVLSGLTRENRYNMGECRNDYGGYFIIDGKEKVVIPQEKFGNNMMYVQDTNDEKYLYLAKIRSVSENASKPVRTLKIGYVTPSASFTNRQIVVEVPNVRKPVPLFILFRALGVLSDRDIIETCVLDMKRYESILDLFIPSVHDAANVMTQQAALEYIRTFVKGQNVDTVIHVLCDYFLPHVGELNFKEKAFHLGHMVLQLLLVVSGAAPPTDRDNFKFKRVETAGDLLYDLFKEYYVIQQKYVALQFEKKVYFAQAQYEDNLTALIQQNYQAILKERIVDTGFRKAFKGNWGATAHTKRLGIVQDLNRLSYFSALNHLRKITLPLDTTSKVVGPRLLNSTQWGLIDPIDTPDGGNIGLHKHMTIGTCISRHVARDDMVEWLRRNCKIQFLSENIGAARMAELSKIFVNGLWVGSVDNPDDVVLKIRLFRRNGLVPLYTSATFEIKSNTVHVFCDAGRLCRPIFYRDEISGKMSYLENKRISERIGMGAYTWRELILGFGEQKRTEQPLKLGYGFHDYADVYGVPASAAATEKDRFHAGFYNEKSVIDYIDTNEEENTLIALAPDELTDRHTHLEIHKSFIFGLMCNMIVFPENNPATRNSFSCGQSKQACSLYSTNYHVRMDKMGVLLNYGQIPLVKTRYLDLINQEQNTYGENAIVAIMCYTGYNVEDAILINEGAIRRGAFQTTYFTVYQGHEETAGVGGAAANIRIGNTEEKTVVGTKNGYDYSHLDAHGIVKEGTVMNDRRIVIGMASPHGAKENVFVDGSVVTKKGQLGVVDKTFITDNAEGARIAKVRVVEQRMPGQGDKFACALPTQQVLTDKGWVEMRDIDIRVHRVATLDCDGNMCYEFPAQKFEYDFDGELYSVKNKQVEMVCTLNHNMYVKRRDKKEYELIPARDIMGKMVRFKKSLKNVGNLRCPALQDVLRTPYDPSLEPPANIDKTNKENYDELKEFFKELELDSNNIKLPEFVWKMSKEGCIMLLNKIMESGISEKGTTNTSLANEISRLSVHCEYSAIIQKCYNEDSSILFKVDIIRDHDENEPYINYSSEPEAKGGVVGEPQVLYLEELIKYTGKVYCVEMPSSNLYYFRENFFAPSMLSGNSRAGQKGTIGLIIPEQDMPFTRDGLRPDLIINPHALPTRQTIGQLVECLLGKATLAYGGFGDGTAFMNRGTKLGTYGDMLVRQGFHSTGNEILYNGMTGEQIESEIFMGPTYYMRLKHMVKDKINYRARGPRTMLTRQPVQGRANDGGLRVGEMEANSIMGHGAMEFLNDAMMNRGDKYKLAVCNKTGMVAIYNPDKNLFLSPMADGPIKFSGQIEEDLRMESVSRFGRDFSVVEVPYSFKLLMQELATINVQMRIITEDNIGQLENMMYRSKNIEKLTYLDDAAKVGDVAKDIVKKDTDYVNRALARIVKENVPEVPAAAPAAPGPSVLFAPTSPETPPFVPVSPTSSTESPETSPQFIIPQTPPSGSAAAATARADFSPDETVFLLGDARPWKVKTVKPDFITVFNPAGTTDSDTIKVVERHEILQPASGVESPPYAPSPQSGGAGGLNPYALSGGAPQAPPLAMPNFNIKIVGGSDFSLAPSAGGEAPAGAPAAAAGAGIPNIESLVAKKPLLLGSAPAHAPAPAAPAEITKENISAAATAAGGFTVVKKE